MKVSMTLIFGLLLSTSAFAQERSFSSRDVMSALRILKLHPQQATQAQTDLCVQAALVSVASQYASRVATALLPVSGIKNYSKLGTVTIRLAESSGSAWVVPVRSRGTECIAGTAHAVKDSDIGGIGGFTVRN